MDIILSKGIMVEELMAINDDDAPVTNMINQSVINHSVSLMYQQPLHSNFLNEEE